MASSQVVAVRRWSWIVLAMLLSACSTADYAEPIQVFSESATAAAQSVRDLNRALAATTLNYAVAAAARDPANNHLEVADTECGAFVPADDPAQMVRCRADFKLKSSLGPEVTISRQDYTDPLGNLVAIMDAISGYASNLAAVQSDNTAKEVDSSIDSIQASLIRLLQATGGQQPPSALPKAAGDAVKWAFGQYLESVKFRALRDATSAAREPLNLANTVFKDIEQSAKIELSAPAGSDAFDSRANMDAKSEASIRATLAAQNAYDDVLTAPLSPMFENLVAAHNDLADALDGSKPLSVREALAKLKEVQKQAETLGQIAADLSAALKKPPSS
jgi:hypothetical protein